MLTLNFTVKQIAFSLNNLWRNLGLNSEELSFKYLLMQQIKANSNLENNILVSVSENTLIRCYVNVSQQPYGITTDMAEELLASLKNQLLIKAAGETEEKQSAVNVLTKIQELKSVDTQRCQNNILETIALILE